MVRRSPVLLETLSGMGDTIAGRHFQRDLGLERERQPGIDDIGRGPEPAIQGVSRRPSPGNWSPNRTGRTTQWSCRAAVTAYFRDLQAAGRSAATLRSYGMDLLRWFRFLWAIDVPWNQATRAEARDFCRWLQVAWKARPARRGCPAVACPAVCAVGAGAQRDGAAQFL